MNCRFWRVNACPYFTSNIPFVTSHCCFCHMWVISCLDYVNMIRKPTESNERYLAVKMRASHYTYHKTKPIPTTLFLLVFISTIALHGDWRPHHISTSIYSLKSTDLLDEVQRMRNYGKIYCILQLTSTDQNKGTKLIWRMAFFLMSCPLCSVII